MLFYFLAGFVTSHALLMLLAGAYVRALVAAAVTCAILYLAAQHKRVVR